MKTLEKLLSDFVEGPDRSRQAAQQIESEILRLGLEEDPMFESLIDGLASYQPGGGEGLYYETEMVEMARRVLQRVQ